MLHGLGEKKNSERNIPTKPKPGGPISSTSSSITAKRPGRDYVVLTERQACLLL